MKREVLSIPASGTVKIINEHGIHAYPHPRAYQNTPFVTFRGKGGIMEKIFSVRGRIVLDPNSDNLLNEIHTLSEENQSKLIGYITDRKKGFGFEKPDCKYMFW